MLFNSFTLSFCFVRCVHFVAFVVFILFVLLISFPAFLSAYLPNILTIFRHSASCEQKEKNKRLRSSRAKTIDSDSEADSFFDICRQSSVTSLENCKQTCLDRQVIFFSFFILSGYIASYTHISLTERHLVAKCRTQTITNIHPYLSIKH